MPKLEQLEDGKILRITLENGEIYEGDPLTATEKLAASKEETNRAYRQEKSAREELQSKVPPPPPPAPSPSIDPTIQKLIVDNLTDYMNVRPEDLKVWSQIEAQDRATMKEWRKHMGIAEFQSKFPEFPNTPEANDALVARAEREFDIVMEDLLAANPKQAAAVLGSAHLYCVRDGTYKPLTPDQYNQNFVSEAKARETPAPPPMIQSRAPDSTGLPQNEWTEPLDKMRARLIHEQLTGQR